MMSANKADAATVAVWRLPLTNAPDDGYLLSLLENAERQRLAHYQNPVVYRRFLICRAAVRLLLAQRLTVEPGKLRLINDAFGKPRLADPDCDLFFNLTHTDGLALIALSHMHGVGVDVEAPRTMRSLSAIARRCFAPAELACWQALPENQHAAAFFSFWTRKEAFAKAVGQGIAIGMQHIEFGIDGELIAVPAGCGHTTNWLVQDLAVGDGFCAAVAVHNPHAQIAVKTLAWQ